MKRSRILPFSIVFFSKDDYGFNLSFISYFGEGKISENSFLSFGKLIVLSNTEELDFLRFLCEAVLELYLVKI